MVQTITVHRDYTQGTLTKFDEAFPADLQGKVWLCSYLSSFTQLTKSFFQRLIQHSSSTLHCSLTQQSPRNHDHHSSTNSHTRKHTYHQHHTLHRTHAHCTKRSPHVTPRYHDTWTSTNNGEMVTHSWKKAVKEILNALLYYYAEITKSAHFFFLPNSSGYTSTKKENLLIKRNERS